jgi:hypothetical protein
MAGIWLSREIRCEFLRHAVLFKLRLSIVLNLAFVQDNSEWFVAFWTIEKPNLKLHLLARFVGSTSHRPFFLRGANFGSTFWTFSHNDSSIMTGYDGLMVNG